MMKMRRLNYFWLSVYLHLLLLLAILIAIALKPKEKKEQAPNYYVPAYTYTGSIKPVMSRPSAQKAETQNNESNLIKANHKLADNSNEQQTMQSVKNTHSTVRVTQVKKPAAPKHQSMLLA